MAKLKKTAGKVSGKPAARKTAPRGKAKQASSNKSITESAQQIWLAGMGAFNRAQAEGSKLFESLVRDGLSLEQTARKFAGTRANVVRGAMESQVGQARERAVDTWDKLEKVFEDRVQRALVKLGVPGREELGALAQRVERLTDVLRKGSSDKPARKTAAKPKPATDKAKKAAKPAAATKVTKATKTAKPRPATKAAKTTTSTKAPRKARASKPAPADTTA